MTSGDINIILDREILLSESETTLKSFVFDYVWFWIVVVPPKLWRPDLDAVNVNVRYSVNSVSGTSATTEKFQVCQRNTNSSRKYLCKWPADGFNVMLTVVSRVRMLCNYLLSDSFARRIEYFNLLKLFCKKIWVCGTEITRCLSAKYFFKLIDKYHEIWHSIVTTPPNFRISNHH
jgi:hypothetical protein